LIIEEVEQRSWNGKWAWGITWSQWNVL